MTTTFCGKAAIAQSLALRCLREYGQVYGVAVYLTARPCEDGSFADLTIGTEIPAGHWLLARLKQTQPLAQLYTSIHQSLAPEKLKEP